MSITGGMYLTATGAYRVPRPPEVTQAGGWTVALVPTSDWQGTVVFSRNSTAQLQDVLPTALVTPCTFYYSNQTVAQTGVALSVAGTWLVPFIGYELYLNVTQTSGVGALQVNLSPLTPLASTLPVVTLAQLDLKQGIPLTFPDDLAFQLQLAADAQQSSANLVSTLTTI